jgi:hypothetical protein
MDRGGAGAVVIRPALALLATAGLALPAFAHPLPLGDRHVSAAPQRGYIMTCQGFMPGAPGAHRTGEWIANGMWDPDGKPLVEGEVQWPNAAISVTREGDSRIVRANNLPLHPSGEFPIRPGSRAYDYDRNPNRIGAQRILLTLPAAPQPAARPGCVPMGMIGFALSGVAIFNAFDAGGRDAPAYEIQDRCNGHPERSSQYHYHNWSPCLTAASANAPVGWMLDGYPILGPRDENGRELTNADLDECHGRTGPVTIDGRTVVTYHYRFTLEFPYTLGCFRGTPVALPRRGPPPGMGPPPR